MAARALKPVNPAEMLSAWLSRNRGRFPTNASLAEALACSEGRLSQILSGGGGRLSPGLAVNIHKVTSGRVPGSAWRPDLWRRPADVPLEAAP